MRLAKEAHAEVLEYIIGMAELNQDLWRRATDSYNAARIGPISRLLIKQRNALKSGLIASAYNPTEIPPAAMSAEAEIVATWDRLHEEIKALWREYEFGERQDGPEMATEPPQLAQDAQTRQREPGEEW